MYKAVASVAAAGHTDICLWLFSEGCASPHSMLEAAVEAGHADTGEQLLAAGCPVVVGGRR
jgi:hypothetical protein